MLKKFTVAVAIIMLISSITVSAQELKGDPWIFQAYKEIYNRKPNAWELNINNYNLGSWNNYDELKRYIQQFQSSLRSTNMILASTPAGKDRTTVVFVQNGLAIAANIVGNAGGNMVAAGGGNMVAAGGGNLVAAGGGNMVAAGGGNLVAAGGGNVTVSLPPNFKIQDLAGASFAPSNTKVLSSAKIVKASGNGIIILK